VVVNVKAFSENFDEISRKNPELEDATQMNKLLFPDVIFPGLSRNDLYITLDSGDFTDLKSPSNIEVSLTVRNDNGEIIKE